MKTLQFWYSWTVSLVCSSEEQSILLFSINIQHRGQPIRLITAWALKQDKNRICVVLQASHSVTILTLYSRTWQHTAELHLVLKGNNTLRYEFFFEFIYIIKFKEILLWFILILLAKSISFHLSKHHHPVISIFLPFSFPSVCHYHLILVHISQSSVFHLNHSLKPMRRRGMAWAKL